MEAVVIATGTNTFFGRTAKLVAGAGAVSHAQKAMFQISNFLIVVAVVPDADHGRRQGLSRYRDCQGLERR
jgi:magnesium-transporting ATPase (P-type)